MMSYYILVNLFLNYCFALRVPQDVLEAAFFLLAVRSLGKCRSGMGWESSGMTIGEQAEDTNAIPSQHGT